jgi:hypothetical protein
MYFEHFFIHRSRRREKTRSLVSGNQQQGGNSTGRPRVARALPLTELGRGERYRHTDAKLRIRTCSGRTAKIRMRHAKSDLYIFYERVDKESMTTPLHQTGNVFAQIVDKNQTRSTSKNEINLCSKIPNARAAGRKSFGALQSLGNSNRMAVCNSSPAEVR